MSAPFQANAFSSAANLNALWASLAFEEWRRLGPSLIVVCPGSRSAPLALAVAGLRGVDCVVAHDERAAGFMALGAARATGRAAIVVTTSGTAVANLLPAAVEARQTGTPIIFVTADRPPELRECGANQTIRQHGLLTNAAVWEIDVSSPEPATPLAYLLSTANEAWQRACGRAGDASGPVHINWAFREPLAPKPEAWDRDLLKPIARWIDTTQPWRAWIDTRRSGEEALDRLATMVERCADGCKRGMVVVGACHSPSERAFAAALARRCSCPVLADIGASLRHDARIQGQVAHGDLITLSQRAGELIPDFIVRLGGNLSSRRLSEFLRRARSQGAREFVVRTGPSRQDPDHAANFEAGISPDGLRWNEQRSQERSTLLAAESFRDAWLAADAAAARAIETFARENSVGISEALTARDVAEIAATGFGLVLGNSMAIRDADMHIANGCAPASVAVNRGASGIDGLVATAVGHARATGEPVIALVGDLSLLHDIGSLSLVAQSPVPIVIVTINNDGGGIFHFLPLAAHEGALDPWTTAPHGLGFSGAAAMFGLDYVDLEIGAAPDALRDALSRAAGLAQQERRSSLVEVKSDRSTNVQQHRAIQQAVVAAIDGLALGARAPVAARGDRS